MNWKEALTEIQEDGIRLGAGDYVGIEALKTATEAIKKQIPQKPRVDENDWYCCRQCGETFFLINMVNERNKYCGKCGQAIDWA